MNPQTIAEHFEEQRLALALTDDVLSYEEMDEAEEAGIILSLLLAA